MRKVAVFILGLALIAGIGLACSSGTVGSGSTTPAEQQQAVDLAKAKLAARLGVDVAMVSVVKVEAVDWPDTSLGVPEPGKFYAQVITPGYKIILSAGGTQYEYHTGKSGSTINVVAK